LANANVQWTAFVLYKPCTQKQCCKNKGKQRRKRYESTQSLNVHTLSFGPDNRPTLFEIEGRLTPEIDDAAAIEEWKRSVPFGLVLRIAIEAED